MNLKARYIPGFFGSTLIVLFLGMIIYANGASAEHQKETKLICFGDSVTLGVRGGTPGVREEETFCSILGKKFDFYKNKGVGGDKTTDMVSRFDSDVLQERPTHLLMMLGINDVYNGKESIDVKIFEKNVESMVRRAKERGVHVTIMTPNIVLNKNWISRFPPYLDSLRRISKDTGSDLIDVYARFSEQYISDKSILKSWYGTLQFGGWDYQHPHNMGHSIIASMCDYHHIPLCNPDIANSDQSVSGPE